MSEVVARFRLLDAAFVEWRRRFSTPRRFVGTLFVTQVAFEAVRARVRFIKPGTCNGQRLVGVGEFTRNRIGEITGHSLIELRLRRVIIRLLATSFRHLDQVGVGQRSYRYVGPFMLRIVLHSIGFAVNRSEGRTELVEGRRRIVDPRDIFRIN